MRTEEEVREDITKHNDKFNKLKGDEKEVWEFWEEDRKLRDELEAFQNAKAEEENNTPEAIEERKKEWKAKQIKNIMLSGIGRRYLNADIKSFICKTQEQKEILKTVKQFISNPFGKSLWLVGVPGTGKTLIGAIICRYCGAKYFKSYQIKDELEYARSFNAKKNPTEVINDYAELSVMIIDEVGRYRSPAEQEYLFRILNERYEMKKPTVLISNMEKKEFGEYLGNPVVDRFREGCKCLEFKGESYRGKDRNEWDGKINDELFEC